jgi:phosphate acyltransferase
VSGRTMRAIRDVALGSTRGKLGGWLLAPSIRRLREEIDPERPGGAYMLGLRQVGVVAHGRFTRRGFARAIEVAAHAVDEDVIGRTRAALEAAGALRLPPTGGGAPGPSEPAATVSGS